MKELSVESLKEPSVFCKALTESSTVEIWAGSTYDPAVLRKIPPEKDAAASVGEAKAHWPLQKERKVRSLSVGLSLVTKPRAKAYGFDFKKWEGVMRAACIIEHDRLTKQGRSLKAELSKARNFRIKAPGETDLTFQVSGRSWSVSDGVIDAADIAEGHLNDQIPAGNIYVAPLETTAEGKVTFNVKEPYRGRSIGKLTWVFKGGKITEFSGNTSIIRLKEDWKKAGGDKDRIAYFSIGFNPSAKTGFTINQVASGAVSVGIGGNEDLGGVNKPGFFYSGTLSGADVMADERMILKKGKIVIK
jgi:leucyl aminopeptidase (aminopeptidase T)